MTKRERLEDLGRLHYMLREVINDDIFEHTDSKHGYEEWVRRNHDRLEDDGFGSKEPLGLDHIFRKMRGLHDKIQECYYIAMGDTDYAQYYAWGHRDEPIEPPKPKEPEPKKDDSIKSNVTSPKWLKKGRARAKL